MAVVSCVFTVFLLVPLATMEIHDPRGPGGISGDALEHHIRYHLHYGIKIDTNIPVQGLHLSRAGPQSVRAVWLRPTKYSKSVSFAPVCSYTDAQGQHNTSVTGTSYTYKAGFFELTLNTAELLLYYIPNRYGTIRYRCGDSFFGYSPIYEFRFHHNSVVNLDHQPGVVPSGPDKVIALLGDMGVANSEDTMKTLINRTQSGEIQMLVHAGDISYADNYDRAGKGNNSYIWVEYFNRIQSLTRQALYMPSPGNHEAQFNFSAYVNWLPTPHLASTPSSTSPFWYSFDYMGVHFTMISTEHDFSPDSPQYNWIQADLKQANTNRAAVPWLFVVGHRPFYCTSIVGWTRCHRDAEKFRSHLEDTFYQQRVDVYVAGHDHSYERTYPVYKESPTQHDYIDPAAPVYIVNGAGGNCEGNDPTFLPEVNYRAFCSRTLYNGFLMLKVTTNQLGFTYIRSLDQHVVDRFTVVRTNA